MADKTAGNYGLEIEKACENGTVTGVPAITAQMRAHNDDDLKKLADEIDAACSSSNLATVRKIAANMIVDHPPTPAKPATDSPTPAEPATEAQQ